MAETEDYDPEMANNTIATGALLACLWTPQRNTKSLTAVRVGEDGAKANQLDVEFEFLNSVYRVTVERTPLAKRGMAD